jgi:hypothetical protein
MLSDERDRAREFLRAVQQDLQSALSQKEILVIERQVSRLS